MTINYITYMSSVLVTILFYALNEILCYFHIGQDGFVEHPKNFDSYFIGSNREVIAFECSYKFDPLTTRPTITWQTCNPDNTFTDVPEATDMFSSPDPRANFPIYVFFQTNFTGYLQLLNSSDPIYNGARYRCKAASNIPGDTAEVFSQCASITQHPSGLLKCVCYCCCGCACVCV